PRRYGRGNLAQAPGDVFVREPMKPVASDALDVEMLGNGVVVGNRTVAMMKSGVEAGDLKQLGMPVQERADRRQVVGLMQRCKRSVLLEVHDYRFIDDDRPVIC